MAEKKNNLLRNPAIIAALIGLCGTLVAALLSSPILLQLIKGTNATATPVASQATLTITPALPDLEVLSISAPTCIKDHTPGSNLQYVQQTIIIRNIGTGSTAALGKFSNSVTFTFGGQRYSLEDWASQKGIVGTPNLDIADLGPNKEADLTLNINLEGNKSYSIEVTANSGADTISETTFANNSLTKDFTSSCP